MPSRPVAGRDRKRGLNAEPLVPRAGARVPVLLRHLRRALGCCGDSMFIRRLLLWVELAAGWSMQSVWNCSRNS